MAWTSPRQKIICPSDCVTLPGQERTYPSESVTLPSLQEGTCPSKSIITLPSLQEGTCPREPLPSLQTLPIFSLGPDSSQDTGLSSQIPATVGQEGALPGLLPVPWGAKHRTLEPDSSNRWPRGSPPRPASSALGAKYRTLEPDSSNCWPRGSPPCLRFQCPGAKYRTLEPDSSNLLAKREPSPACLQRSRDEMQHIQA